MAVKVGFVKVRSGEIRHGKDWRSCFGSVRSGAVRQGLVRRS